MGGLRRVFRFALLLTLLNGIFAGVSTDLELMEPAESGRTMRVMVRKEFQLQPDGSYKEVSFDEQEISPKMDVDHEVSESSPPYSYLAAPYGFPTQDNEPQGSGQYYQFSPEDVKDIMSQFEATYGRQEQQLNFVDQQTNHTEAASAHSAVTSSYPNYEIKKAPSQAYFVQQSSAQSQNYGAPASIQAILKTSGSAKKQPSPSSSQSSHYYSPKDQYDYNNYDTTGPAAGYEDPAPAYGTPTGPGPSESYGAPFVPTPVPEYGAPGLAPHSQWSSSYGDVKPGGGVGGVVNSLAGTVRGVGQAKAAVGSQILNQGGKVVQQAVHQKGEKARIIFSTLGSVPARFSEVLRNKAHVATGFLDSGSRALNSALNVKAQAAKSAGNLISAKGKAATAVIKASGGTAADLILALGRGSARFISGSGAVATNILNAKGNTVAKIAEVLGGVGGGHGGGGYIGGGGGGYVGGGGGGSHGHGGGWENEAIVGGYSENEEQYDSAPSPVYDELKLQNALKSVVESPASSYGEPPQASLTSAFKSIYNTFKSNQPSVSSGPIGAYSAPVAVSVSPPDSQEKPSIKESAASLGDSLNKMSKMFNSVASAIDWLSPKKENESS